MLSSRTDQVSLINQKVVLALMESAKNRYSLRPLAHCGQSSNTREFTSNDGAALHKCFDLASAGSSRIHSDSSDKENEFLDVDVFSKTGITQKHQRIFETCARGVEANA